MRLLFVGTLPEPGGAASHFITLVQGMAEQGHTIGVVAASASDISRALAGDPRITMYDAQFLSTFDRVAMRTLRRAIAELRPQRVIAVYERDYWGAAVVCARARVSLSLFLHHAGLKRANRIALRHVRHHVLVPSASLRQWLLDRGAAEARVDVLPNPVDTDFFRPDAALRQQARAMLGVADDDVLVGYVGRFESNKGVLPFAESVNEAMAVAPKLRALWVGFGQRERELDAIIHAGPAAARHVRRPWTHDMRAFYVAMDLLALPSTGPESFGRVLVEAQSSGLPVIGSDIGGIPETMLVGATGRLVAPGDVGAWAGALVEMAQQPSQRESMGAAGRHFVRAAFDCAVIARRFEEMLRKGGGA